MNSFNSHGNNLSRSEGKPNGPYRVFPAFFPFQLTDAFRDQFSGPAYLALPSSFNLPYWKKNIGGPAYQVEVQRVDAANQQALAEYAASVARIDVENERRIEANRVKEHEHQKALDRHQVQLAQYKRERSELKRRKVSVKKLLRKAIIDQRRWELTQLLWSQHNDVYDAIELVRETADREKHQSGLTWIGRLILIAGLGTSPTIFGPSICACAAYAMRSMNKYEYRSRFAELLNAYNTTRGDVLGKRKLFWLRDDGDAGKVVTPIRQDQSGDDRETNPLGSYELDAFFAAPSFSDFVKWLIGAGVCAIPGIGFVAMLCLSFDRSDDLRELATDIRSGIGTAREDRLSALLLKELKIPQVIRPLVEERLASIDFPSLDVPRKPLPPTLEPQLPIPSAPMLEEPRSLEAPDWCFDTSERDDFSHVLKGARLYSRQHVHNLAKFRVFADSCVNPYVMFGGVPIPLAERAPNTLVLGTSGSGKTTTIVKMASAVLPLTSRQVERVHARSESDGQRFPVSAEEWSRSFTHQAIVYNAKGEYLNHLKAFGFDQDIDLFNFDPADPKCYAWDICSDIDDADSMTQFAEQLIPRSTSSKQDDGYEMWLSNARGAVEAVIVSLRNSCEAAGKPPIWNLRDLVRAFSTTKTLQHILQWHDIPQEKLSRYFDLASAQRSSVFVTLWQAIDRFSVIANRWDDAQQRGRMISLKKWATRQGGTILILPNTKINVDRYGPLNAMLLKAITNIVLQHQYSFYRDESDVLRCYRREFIIDEVGQAGRLHELERLMSEGRSFGVHVTIGLHQLSQLTETYGEHVAETILGLCSNRAFLRTDDQRTAEWMSKYVGNCLRSYGTESFTYGTTHGKTFSTSTQSTSGQSRGVNRANTLAISEGTADAEGSSTSDSSSSQLSHATTPGQKSTTTKGSGDSNGTGTSQSHTHNETINWSQTEGTNHQDHESTTTSHSEGGSETSSSSKTNSVQLRGEAAIEPHEFMGFSHPETAGVCEVVNRVPTLPIWRGTLTMEEMAPSYECPERLSDWPSTRSVEEDRRVSRSTPWSMQDLNRLGLDLPAPQVGNGEDTLTLPGSLPSDGRAPNQQRLLGFKPDENAPSEGSAGEDQPLSDFDF